MTKIFSTLLAMSFYISMNAQSFGVQDTIKYLVKDVNSSTPPHDYIQLTNNTNDTLHLRWVETKQAGFPAAWDLGLQDPQTYYYPQVLDSADFYIESPASTLDKMIINLFHNNTAGTGRVKYKIYDIANPSDSLNIYFDFTITAQGQSNGISENSADYFTHTVSQNELIITSKDENNIDRIQLFSIDGKLIRDLNSSEATTSLQLPESTGVYIVLVSIKNQRFSFKIKA